MADQIQVVGTPSSQDLDKANDELFRFKAVFPFDFFPDVVVLDRFKINIIKKDFFLSSRVITIPLSGSVGVKVNSGPFFSQVEIFDPGGGKERVLIQYVQNSDATQFRELVEGLVVGIRQGVDFMSMEKEEVIRSAMNWGAVITE